MSDQTTGNYGGRYSNQQSGVNDYYGPPNVQYSFADKTWRNNVLSEVSVNIPPREKR